MATIIAIVIAVVVDRYVQQLPSGSVMARVRSTAWLNTYLTKCISILDKLGIKQSYLVALSAVVPLCLGILILKLLFGILLGKIGSLLFLTFALFYFLGNREVELPASEYVVTHETSFGIMFWFAVIGTTGAMLYWFLVVSKQTGIMQDPNNLNLRNLLARVHALAAWIPARITAFLYALVGNFTPGFRCWLNCIRNPKMLSSDVLQECGQAAADANTVGDSMRLVMRTYIAWVIFILFMYKMGHFNY
jgi:membrane protein required for beta-lactamase induction